MGAPVVRERLWPAKLQGVSRYSQCMRTPLALTPRVLCAQQSRGARMVLMLTSTSKRHRYLGAHVYHKSKAFLRHHIGN